MNLSVFVLGIVTITSFVLFDEARPQSQSHYLMFSLFSQQKELQVREGRDSQVTTSLRRVLERQSRKYYCAETWSGTIDHARIFKECMYTHVCSSNFTCDFQFSTKMCTAFYRTSWGNNMHKTSTMDVLCTTLNASKVLSVQFLLWPLNSLSFEAKNAKWFPHLTGHHNLFGVSREECENQCAHKNV